MSAPPQYSPDGKWWWNGQAWVPTTPGMQVPPRRAWIRDWANESLIMGAAGWFCSFFLAFGPIFLLLGLIGGIIALSKSPYRNRAIGGIVLNAVGLAVFVAILISKASH